MAIKPFVQNSGCSELDRIKILLLTIDTKLRYMIDYFTTYKVVGTLDVMSVFIPKYDLVVILIKPNNITSPDAIENVDKKVTICIRQMSSYGNYIPMIKYDFEEIQIYAKNLYFNLINRYYGNLSSVDKILDSVTSPSSRTKNDIFFALIDDLTHILYMNDEQIKSNIDKFDQETKKEALKSSGRHPLFF